MGLAEWLVKPLRFHPIQVSVFTVLVYGLLFVSVLVNYQTPDVSKDLTSLNLTQAYDDLHRLTARPHPYSSHANDEVRAFILSRLETILETSNISHISNDLTANASYATGPRQAVYFEGSNIIVKIDGTNPGEADGVLFSAHFDSVATAPGATDNGVAVVSLLQLVEHFSHPSRQPRRNAIFLFNNGEEDGVNGAHAFFEHPWASLASIFVNLDGAGAGGRLLLFRSTSLNPVLAYSSDYVSHPLTSSLTMDAFSRGLVRSGTDFSVFQKGIRGEKDGLSGLDLAFYEDRALYHTPLDSIPGMGRGESKRALWIMLDTVRGVGTSMLNEERADDGGDRGVYFDLFGTATVAFSRTALFVSNIVFLALGPISIMIILAWVLVIASKHERSTGDEESASTAWRKIKKVFITALSWGRFWITLAICVAVQVGLVVGYIELNPFAVHAYPYCVLTTSLSLAFLAFVFPLSLFHYFIPGSPTTQKFAILLELFFFFWVLLLVATILSHRLDLGGFYWITAWYLCVWVASLLGLAQAAERASQGKLTGRKRKVDLVGERVPTPVEEDPDGVRRVRGVLYEIPEEREREHREDSSNGYHEPEPVETEPTEITPLMRQHRMRSTGGREYVRGVDNGMTLVIKNSEDDADADDEELGWWILQYLALIPFPTILLFQLAVLLLHALGQTLVDGNSPVTVYAGIATLSILIFIGLSPFAHRIHYILTLLVALVFIASLLYTWIAFPFTQEAPVKLFFHQKIELDIPSLRHPQIQHVHSSDVRAFTRLTGPRDYVDRSLITELPSSWGKDLDCTVDRVHRIGLWSCSWESDLIPSPGGNATDDVGLNSLLSSSGAIHAADWLHATVTRTGPNNGTIAVRGTNSRLCRIRFDNPISDFNVRDSGRVQPGYEIPEETIQDLVLWSRTWDNEFVVDVQWPMADNASAPLTGSVACEWTEYASASAGSSYSATSGLIPALEEALHYLPLWATVSKWTYGLVEAEARFAM